MFQECLHRWSKTLNPNIKRGRWTLEEDNRLRLACHAYQNHNWIKIQQHIPGRTDVQCRERWCNIINPVSYFICLFFKKKKGFKKWSMDKRRR